MLFLLCGSELFIAKVQSQIIPPKREEMNH